MFTRLFVDIVVLNNKPQQCSYCYIMLKQFQQKYFFKILSVSKLILPPLETEKVKCFFFMFCHSGN